VVLVVVVLSAVLVARVSPDKVLRVVPARVPTILVVVVVVLVAWEVMLGQ
jgi:hypothetical protein